MRSRTLLFAVALAASMVATAAERLAADSLALVRIEHPLSRLHYHLRAEAHRSKAATLSLFWNYADSLNHRRAELQMPAAGESLYAQEAPLTIIRRVDGVDSTLYAGTVAVAYGPDGCLSMRLTALGSGAALEVGTDEAAAAIPVDFDLDRPQALAIKASRALTLPINFLFTADGVEAPERPAATAAPLAGLWQFLDRDMDSTLAFLPRKYTLEVVADGEAYLIYTDTGEYKGRLTPSPFAGHWYLSWRTADGRLLEGETSADIETAGTILRLNFPLLRTTLRFVKAET